MHLDSLKSCISEVAQGNETAFRELHRHYYPGLLSFATSLTKNQQVGEELVADVFIKIWERRSRLTKIGHFSSYIYTAVKNAAIDHLRVNNKNICDDMGDDFEYSYISEMGVVQNENISQILNAVNALPPRCRLIFRLVKDEGLAYSEVAALLHISERTVNAQLVIAIAKIAENLNKTLPEFSIYYGKKKSG